MPQSTTSSVLYGFGYAMLGRRKPLESWEREAFFHVEGLSCRTCARHAEEALRRLDGVRGASVLFMVEAARVLFDLRRTSEREIVAAMARGGFRLQPIDGVPPSARAGLGLARLALTIDLCVTLFGLSAAERVHGTNAVVTWSKLALCALTLLVGASPLIHRAWALARRGIFGSDVLAIGAALFAFGIGTATLALGQAPAGFTSPSVFGLGPGTVGRGFAAFETAAAIVLVNLVVRHAYAVTRLRAMRAIAARASREEKFVKKIDDAGGEEPIATRLLSTGDRIRLLEGDTVPTNLRLDVPARVCFPAEGGWNEAVDKKAGDVIGQGAKLLSAAATGRVLVSSQHGLDRVADAEVLRALCRLEREPPAGNDSTSWPHVAAFTISVAAFAYALFALVVHSLAEGRPGGLSSWVAALAVLLASSQAAATLAEPAARAIVLLRAREAGVLLDDPGILERLASVNVACFGKTGALTTAEVKVSSIHWLASADSEPILEQIAALERYASHPVGHAIAAYLSSLGVQPASEVEGVVDSSRGISGRVGGAFIAVGHPARFGNPQAEGAALESTQVWFSKNGLLLGWFELVDSLRAEAEQVVRALHQRGVSCRILSGDRREAAVALAHRLGIAGEGGMRPFEKALAVRDLQHGGARVLFVGDARDGQGGAARADVVAVMARGVLPSAAAAPIVLLDGRLESLPWLVDLARAHRARLRESFALATVYNALAIPFAAAGWISPGAAAVLGLVEALLVLGNATRLMTVPAAPKEVEIGKK